MSKRYWKLQKLDTVASGLEGRAVWVTVGSYASEPAAKSAQAHRYPAWRGGTNGTRVTYAGPRGRTAADPPTCHH